MATDFGFEPTGNGPRYFVSYKMEDANRVAEIARFLNEKGVPLWYDYALEYGKEWEHQISININAPDTKAMIMFVTYSTFSEKTYQEIEFNSAKEKANLQDSPFSIYVVWLDNVIRNVVPDKYKLWYDHLKLLHSIMAAGEDPNKIATTMINRLNLIHDLTKAASESAEQDKEPPPDIDNNKDDESNNPPEPPNVFLTLVKKAIIPFAILGIVCCVPYVASILHSSSDNDPSIVATSTTGTYLSPISIQDLKKGDRNIIWGSYPQGKNGEVEPLTWRILDVKDGKALLVTEKLIECLQYNEDEKPVAWISCSLRAWLNETFIMTAFSDSERSVIIETTNINPDNSAYKTGGGRDTTDKVFILSIDEAEALFEGNEDRKAAVTPYAISHGAYANNGQTLSDGQQTGTFWLRSPGLNSIHAATVGRDGGIYMHGSVAYTTIFTVRPAIWIEL